jgi:hypothetical protein
MANDLWDNWTDLNAMFDLAASWYTYAGAGHWPDADMIPIGKLQGGRASKFTTDEKYTLMTLWCIIRSPLIWGGELVNSSAEDLKFMQNSEVIAVNQHSINNKLAVTGNTPIWVADVPGTQSKYVAVFNRNGSPANVTINFNTLGVTTDSDTLRDLWTKNNLGVFSGSYSVNLSAHQSKLYRLSPPGTTTVIERKATRAGIMVNSGFETGISKGKIIVIPGNDPGRFDITLCKIDGRLVTHEYGLTGTTVIPVVTKGIYLVNIKSNGHIERKLVSCF